MVKNTSVAPAGTVTVLGTVVNGELSNIETTAVEDYSARS
jgi:hypothetical protein